MLPLTLLTTPPLLPLMHGPHLSCLHAPRTPSQHPHTLTRTLTHPHPRTRHKVGEQIQRIAHDQAERRRYQGAREAAAATQVQAAARAVTARRARAGLRATDAAVHLQSCVRGNAARGAGPSVGPTGRSALHTPYAAPSAEQLSQQLCAADSVCLLCFLVRSSLVPQPSRAQSGPAAQPLLCAQPSLLCLASQPSLSAQPLVPSLSSLELQARGIAERTRWVREHGLMSP